MSGAYGVPGRGGWHRWRDAELCALAASTVVGVWIGSAVGVVTVAAFTVVARRPFVVVVLCVLAAEAGAWRGTQSWAAAEPRHLGAYTGPARVVADPVTVAGAVRLTVEIEGERFDAYLFGGSRRRVVQRHAGEIIDVEGTRRVGSRGKRRAQIRHVVGRFDAEVLGDWRPGSPLARSASRVRESLRRSAEASMGAVDASLFTGLAIGDDARQPVWMVDTFRESGLSHLTAVSGENVAFVVAAASPLLRRLRTWWRWCATAALIGWFMAVTQFEPSVLRAGFMAIIACTATLTGRPLATIRVLSATVTVLVLVDPMLVWSVGFWLSTGATAGVCLLSPPLARALPGPDWLRLPMSVTIAAQAGVALPALLVFRRLPLVSLPANLLAVPVAGFVMLFGIPAGLFAAAVPVVRPAVMLPCVLATRWVAAVAAVGAALEPRQTVSIAGWVGILGVIVVLAVRRHRAGSPGDVPI